MQHAYKHGQGVFTLQCCCTYGIVFEERTPLPRNFINREQCGARGSPGHSRTLLKTCLRPAPDTPVLCYEKYMATAIKRLYCLSTFEFDCVLIVFTRLCIRILSNMQDLTLI